MDLRIQLTALLNLNWGPGVSEDGCTRGDTSWGKHLLRDVVFSQIPLNLTEGLGDIEVNES